MAGGIVVGTVAGIYLGAVATNGAGRSSAAGSTFAAFGMCAPVYWVGAMFIVFIHPEVGKFARLPISGPTPTSR